MISFNPMDHPVCLEVPGRLSLVSAWAEHIPFGMYIIDVLKPKLVVELGTHMGLSYCAFCQAITALNLSTKCFAVDTWRGDKHTGFYGDEILTELRGYHDPLYGHFSQLLQSTFDDAVQHFSEGSIDLLHIDGMHTYEAVKHDFETWLPKVSCKGVILFHDTNVREGDFGVWRFWEEAKSQFPSFEFFHGHGLGLLAVGKEIYPEVNHVFEPENAPLLRNFFSSLGKKYDLNLTILNLSTKLGQMERASQNFSSNLSERDQTIANLQQTYMENLAERDQTIANLQQTYINNLAERDQTIANLQQNNINNLAERDQTIANLQQNNKYNLAERDKTIVNLWEEQIHLEQRNQTLVAGLDEQRRLVLKLRDELTISQNEVVEYVQSHSWKITRPFRKLKKFLTERLK